MKTDIHPKYYANATITCSCGNVMKMGATVETFTTDMCSACHPVYTGKKRTVDTAGRIEQFEAKRKKAEESKAAASANKGTKKKKTIEEKVNEELKKDMDRERKEEEKLMSKIRKNRPVEVEETA